MTHVKCTEIYVLGEEKIIEHTYVQGEESSIGINKYDSDWDNDDGTISLPSVYSWGD